MRLLQMAHLDTYEGIAYLLRYSQIRDGICEKQWPKWSITLYICNPSYKDGHNILNFVEEHLVYKNIQVLVSISTSVGCTFYEINIGLL